MWVHKGYLTETNKLSFVFNMLRTYKEKIILSMLMVVIVGILSIHAYTIISPFVSVYSNNIVFVQHGLQIAIALTILELLTGLGVERGESMLRHFKNTSKYKLWLSLHGLFTKTLYLYALIIFFLLIMTLYLPPQMQVSLSSVAFQALFMYLLSFAAIWGIMNAIGMG